MADNWSLFLEMASLPEIEEELKKSDSLNRFFEKHIFTSPDRWGPSDIIVASKLITLPAPTKKIEQVTKKLLRFGPSTQMLTSLALTRSFDVFVTLLNKLHHFDTSELDDLFEPLSDKEHPLMNEALANYADTKIISEKSNERKDGVMLYIRLVAFYNLDPILARSVATDFLAKPYSKEEHLLAETLQVLTY